MSDCTRHAAAFLCLMVLSGCGGSKPASAPPMAAPPAAPPPTIAAAGGNRQPQRPRVPNAEPAVREAAKPKLPDVPASQLFVLREDAPGVELIPPEVAAEDDLYAIAAPASGLNSSIVRLVPPDGEQPGIGVRPPTPPVALPQGFVAAPEGGYADSGMPRQIRCEKDNSLMVFVSGGLFLEGEDGVDAEAGPAHPVDVGPYYMDQTEVTLAQFESFRADHTPRPAAAGNAGDPSDHPVVGIPWRSAAAYCKWAGKELPTEAEWEKAARGPDGFVYPWGDGRVVWERARMPNQIDPVKSFRADRSVYGVFDLAGNAREWCADNYAPDIYTRDMNQSGGVVKNPAGPNRPAVTGHRVVRGNAPHWQLWFRSSEDLSSSPADVGFRGVLRITLPEDGATAGDAGNAPPPTRVPGAGPAAQGDRGF